MSPMFPQLIQDSGVIPLTYSCIFQRIETNYGFQIHAPVLYNNSLFNSPVEIDGDDEVDAGDLYLRFQDEESKVYQVLVTSFIYMNDVLGS